MFRPFFGGLNMLEFKMNFFLKKNKKWEKNEKKEKEHELIC